MSQLDMINKIYTESKMYRVVMSEMWNNPEAFSKLGFDLHQLVAGTLRLYLEFTGAPVSGGQCLHDLVRLCNSSNSKVRLTDWLIRNSYMLTVWRDQYNYNSGIHISLKELKEADESVFSFLEMNGISECLLPEVTDEVLESIKEVCGINIANKSNAIKNVLYNIYLRPGKPRPYGTLDTYFQIYGIKNRELEMKRLQQLYCTHDVNRITRNVYRDFM